MKNIRPLRLFLGLMLFISADAAADVTCQLTTNSANPINLNINEVGTVYYTCTGIRRTLQYTLDFNGSDDVTISNPYTRGPAPHPVMISGSTPGTYSLSVSHINWGQGPIVATSSPLTVVIGGGPPPTINPTFSLTNNTCSGTPSVEADHAIPCALTFKNTSTVSATNVFGTSTTTNGNLSPTTPTPCQTVTAGNSCPVSYSYTPTAPGNSTVITTLSFDNAAGAEQTPVSTDTAFHVTAPPPTKPTVSGSVSCVPNPVTAGQTASCTATFNANGAAPPASGMVDITDASGYISGGSGSCAGTNDCSFSADLVVPSNAVAATDIVTATYTNTAVNNSPYQTTDAVTITPITPPPSTAITATFQNCNASNPVDYLSSNYPTNITCNILLTNNSSTTYSQSQLNFSLTPIPAVGTFAYKTNTCAQLNSNGGTCVATFDFTFTQPIDAFNIPLAFELQSDSKVLASANSALTLQNNEYAAISLSCPTTFMAPGATIDCNIFATFFGPTINTPNNPDFQFPLQQNQGSVNVTQTAIASQGQTTIPFTYTAPDNPQQNSVTLSLNYSDATYIAQAVPLNASITLNFIPQVTMSGISCNPEAITDQQTQCDVVLTNNSANDATLNNPAVTVNGTPVNGIAGCGTSVPGNGACVATFVVPKQSNTSAVIEAKYADISVTKTVPVIGNNPFIQANPVDCQSQHVAPNAPVNCSVLFRNLSSTTASQVSVNGSHQLVCSADDSMAAGGTCAYTFTMTSPAGSADYVTENLLYSDAAQSYPLFLSPMTLPYITNQNTLITGNLIPNAGNVMPLRNVPYNSANTMLFNFFNGLPGTSYALTPHILFVKNGQPMNDPSFLNQVIDTAASSCIFNPSLESNAACNIQLTFQPNYFNGFKVGDQITVYAWVTLAGGGDSQVASHTFNISEPNIYGGFVSNAYFISAAKDGFKGAFVFGNNSANDLSNMRPVRVFLPAGFAVDASCPSELSKRFSDAPTCANTLTAGSYCSVCFTGTSTTQTGNENFEAQLLSENRISTVKKTIPIQESYRHLHLNNQCPGPVWPAFVGGAAYYYCNNDNDCPLNTKCYQSGHQCMVPASSANAGVTCPSGFAGYQLPADFINGGSLASGGCSQGCLSANVKESVCPSGSSCNESNGICYWSLPSESSNDPTPMTNWQLNASQQSILQLPNTPLTQADNWSAVWSGGVIGRTGCYWDSTKGPSGDLVCLTGYCPVNSPTDYSCKRGVGPLPPATQAEFTFLYLNNDFYDVEIINGMSVPVSMKPMGYSGTPLSETPYVCNVAGEEISGANTCPWSFAMTNYNIANSTSDAYSSDMTALHSYVTNGGKTCDPTAPQCSNNEVCGLSQANSTTISNNAPAFTCGKLLGFWSTNQICGANKTLNYRSLNCSDPSPGGVPLYNYFGCNGSGGSAISCYGSGAGPGASCCGCPYWSLKYASGDQVISGLPTNTPLQYLQSLFQPPFKVLQPNGNNDYCVSNSPFWVNNILGPSLIWMKQGCSSVYTFAFDDPTSTFTCSSASVNNGQAQNPAGIVNTQDYEITFCPNNKTGTINNQQVELPGEVVGDITCSPASISEIGQQSETQCQFVVAAIAHDITVSAITGDASQGSVKNIQPLTFIVNQGSSQLVTFKYQANSIAAGTDEFQQFTITLTTQDGAINKSFSICVFNNTNSTCAPSHSRVDLKHWPLQKLHAVAHFLHLV